MTGIESSRTVSLEVKLLTVWDFTITLSLNASCAQDQIGLKKLHCETAHLSVALLVNVDCVVNYLSSAAVKRLCPCCSSQFLTHSHTSTSDETHTELRVV